MAKKDDPKNPRSQDPKPPKVSPEDFDKTTLDIDIRQLKEGFDETVIVRAPKMDDSDLHNMEFFDEERTGDHEVDEAAGKVLEDPTEKPPKKKAKETRPSKEEKAREKRPPPSPVPEPVAGREEEEIPRERPPVVAHIKPSFSPAYMALALVLFLFLAEGLVEVLRQGVALRLPAILAVGFSLLCIAGALLRRWEGRNAFLGTALAWFGLVTYAGFRFSPPIPIRCTSSKPRLRLGLGRF